MSINKNLQCKLIVTSDNSENPLYLIVTSDDSENPLYLIVTSDDSENPLYLIVTCDGGISNKIPLNCVFLGHPVEL